MASEGWSHLDRVPTTNLFNAGILARLDSASDFVDKAASSDRALANSLEATLCIASRVETKPCNTKNGYWRVACESWYTKSSNLAGIDETVAVTGAAEVLSSEKEAAGEEMEF